jgi:hypothetical protein
LILGREPDDRAFLNGLARGFLRGGNDEVRQRTAISAARFKSACTSAGKRASRRAVVAVLGIDALYGILPEHATIASLQWQELC